jgi:hypothetical protein
MELASRLHSAIEKVCPIVGLRIGKRDDKETWQIAFADETTKKQRAAAMTVLAAFDADAPDNLPASPSVAGDLAALKAALIEEGIITEAKIEAAKRVGRRQPSI